MSEHDPYLLTSSGDKFYFKRPEDFPYTIGQIATTLSNLCRFNGNTSRFYSVAQHSVFVSRVVPKEYALEALLHDASEAFLGDITSPLKALLPTYEEMEADTQFAIFERFGIKRPLGSGLLSPEVHQGDMVALATEKRDLMPHDDSVWPQIKGVTPSPFPLHPLPPAEARGAFEARFVEIINL